MSNHPLKVFLANRGNIDYHQDHSKPLPGTLSDYFRGVDSLESASLECRLYIEKYDLGGGNFVGGQIFKGEEMIAYVSYNGRVWGKESENFAAHLRLFKSAYRF